MSSLWSMPLLGRKRQIRGRFQAIALKVVFPFRIESESIFSFFKSRLLLVFSWKLSYKGDQISGKFSLRLKSPRIGANC